MNHRNSIPPLIIVLFIIDVVLALLYVVNVTVGQPFEKVTVLFNLDDEANLPTWFSSAQWLLAACVWSLFAFRRMNAKKPLTWALFAWPLVFLLFSLDETAQLHEWLGWKGEQFVLGGSRKGTVFWETGMWMVLLGVPLVLFMIGIVRSSMRYLLENARVFRLTIVGLLVFVLSSMIFEVLSNVATNRGVWSMIEVTFEEFGEMISQTLLVWAAYVSACSDWVLSAREAPSTKKSV